MDPGELGVAMTLPLGKHSGRHAFAKACSEAGINLDRDALAGAFARFKSLADVGDRVTLADVFVEVPRMSRKRYSISYLAGHGIGAEITAQASRVAAAAAAMHGFTLDDEHVAFGSDAFVRYGNPFPPASRRAVAASDAVLVPADEAGARTRSRRISTCRPRCVFASASTPGRRGDARRAARRGALGLDGGAGLRAPPRTRVLG